jgi:hypothetical protein
MPYSFRAVHYKRDETFDVDALWGHQNPVKVRFPEHFPVTSKALDWALSVAERDSAIKGTALRKLFKGRSKSGSEMVYVSRGGVSENTRTQMLALARTNEPIQLQVDKVDEVSPEYGDYIRKHLVPEFERLYPFGFLLDCVLFVTGAGHKYNVHNDLSDGFLYQLNGAKKVVTWDVDPRFFDQIIFDHNFRRRKTMFFGRKRAFMLSPGEGIFLPRGVLHEISVPSGDQSVSLSFRAEHVYPLLTFCGDLCALVGDTLAYRVKPPYSHWSKFREYVFDPSRFRYSLASPPSERLMPNELARSLSRVIDGSSRVYRMRKEKNFNDWWKRLSIDRKYPGALPIPPEDKGEWLRKQEKRRIAVAK